MARPALYSEGATMMNIYTPKTVRDGLRTVAQRPPRRSVSQLASAILEDWLARRGDLPVPEPIQGDGKGA